MHFKETAPPVSKTLQQLLPRLTPFIQNLVILLAIFAVLISVVQQLTNIDLRLADYFFSQAHHAFLWRDTWFASDFMHSYVKKTIILFGLCWLFLTALDAIAPWQRINKALRLRLRFVAISSVLIPLVISTFKHNSILHCPNDIVRYGGGASYLRLFDALPAGAQAGQCFPAGHASTGLWLAAICVFWLPSQPKKAVLAFIAGISAGFALGWVQQMRGEHFLSHTLWSMWLASAIIVLMLSFVPQLHPEKNPL